MSDKVIHFPKDRPTMKVVQLKAPAEASALDPTSIPALLARLEQYTMIVPPHTAPIPNVPLMLFDVAWACRALGISATQAHAMLAEGIAKVAEITSK